MKKSHIRIPHKCGSVILSKIIREACEKSKVKFEDLHWDTPSPQENPEEYLCSFSRRLDHENIGFKWNKKNKDKYLFVIRHPISRLISAYYSFGWTHGTKASWIKDPKKRKKREKKMLEKRKKIQSLTLKEYIINSLAKKNTGFGNKSQRIINKFIEKCVTSPKPNNTLILPYELFISRPVDFFNEAFRFLELPIDGQYILKEYKDEITPVSDSTEKIKKEGLKTHRRSSDIHEWKNKINIEDLLNTTTEKNRLYINNYLKFLKKFNVT